MEKKHKDKQYPVKSAKVDSPVWEQFNKNRTKLDLSWNQFIKHINQLLKK